VKGTGLSQFGIILDVWRSGRSAPHVIESRQKARLASLVAHAQERSPYYRELYGALPETIGDLAKLPPATKPELMARFDDWVTDPGVTREGVEAFVADESLVGRLYLEKYAACFTSGTTGVRGLYLQDQDAMAIAAALTLVRGIMGLVANRPQTGRKREMKWRKASVIATGGHFATHAITERTRRRFPRLFRNDRTFSILTPLSRLVRELNEYQPTILTGYPNAIAVLAHESTAGRLRIAPGVIITMSETLDDASREEIAGSFGCAVRSWYGAAEARTIAFDCDRGWMHVHADWVILEAVDDALQPVPPGQESHTVLLTNLANRVQPIIRYDLGDRIVVRPEPCPCGSLLPAIRIAGRSHDIPVFVSPQGSRYKVMPVVLSTAGVETPGVQRYQVIQTAPARLTVRFEPSSDSNKNQVWESLSRHLRQRLSDQEVPFVEIDLDPESPRPDPVSGKYRTVAVEMEET
jgi:phenylacetate-coenzyme A ligase PaaK-like adenylate-forming protein